jgi:hypothetical protein
MQPLDVSVFGPMKRQWRKILTAWKEECARKGENFATIPKQVMITVINNFKQGTVPVGTVPYDTGTGYGTVPTRYGTGTGSKSMVPIT